MTITEKKSKIIESGRKAKILRSRFRGKQGTEALELLKEMGFYNKSTYVHGDPYGTALNEGCRQMVLKILEYVNMDDAEIDKQVEEKIRKYKDE